MRQTGLSNRNISVDTANFHRQGLGSVPVQFVWDLWWEIWNWAEILHSFAAFSCKYLFRRPV